MRTLVANNTRIWVYCGDGTPVGPGRGRERGQPVQREVPGELHAAHQQDLPASTYIAAGGTNGVFNFPENGTHQLGLLGLRSCRP